MYFTSLTPGCSLFAVNLIAYIFTTVTGPGDILLKHTAPPSVCTTYRRPGYLRFTVKEEVMVRACFLCLTVLVGLLSTARSGNSVLRVHSRNGFESAPTVPPPWSKLVFVVLVQERQISSRVRFCRSPILMAYLSPYVKRQLIDVCSATLGNVHALCRQRWWSRW